jgi:hypothetical protein
MGQENLNRTILAIACIINLLVAFNAVVHDPFIGYDADNHLDYVSVLAVRLPAKSDSLEYYSPPLPYFLPSLVFQLCESNTITCKYVAGKFAQGVNLLLSIAITVFLIKIADLIRPKDQHFKIATLLMFGVLTVHYKTFSQVRGEPYVAFFEVLSIYFVLKLAQTPETLTLKDGILPGICLGGLCLSRQFGFLLLPAIGCLAGLIVIRNKTLGLKYSGIILFSFFVAFLSSSWFYFHLNRTYGSFTSYAIRPRTFSFSNQPLSFYRNTGIGNFSLFRSPTRKTFNNELIPIFYSETWGDYWGYFVFRREGILAYKSNQAEVNPYLGRVNLVSLIPSLIFAGGMLFGLGSLRQSLISTESSFESRAFSFFVLIVLISLAGYLWYLLTYTMIPKGATIKATYMIQIFMVIPFLAASFLEKIRATNSRLYFLSLGLILAVFVHNVPAMITHYWRLHSY